MTAPQVEILGVHSLAVDEALFRDALRIKYPHGAGAAQRRQVLEELTSAVLIELTIDGADASYAADDFHQPGSEQAAYAETYLSADGTSAIAEYDRPLGKYLRVAFFLHFFDATRPLGTSYGAVHMPPVTPMPDRLTRLIQYEPVD